MGNNYPTRAIMDQLFPIIDLPNLGMLTCDLSRLFPLFDRIFLEVGGGGLIQCLAHKMQDLWNFDLHNCISNLGAEREHPVLVLHHCICVCSVLLLSSLSLPSCLPSSHSPQVANCEQMTRKTWWSSSNIHTLYGKQWTFFFIFWSLISVLKRA